MQMEMDGVIESGAPGGGGLILTLTLILILFLHRRRTDGAKEAQQSPPSCMNGR
jgi:MYXO-CTERM domain-containing protein